MPRYFVSRSSALPRLPSFPFQNVRRAELAARFDQVSGEAGYERDKPPFQLLRPGIFVREGDLPANLFRCAVSNQTAFSQWLPTSHAPGRPEPSSSSPSCDSRGDAAFLEFRLLPSARPRSAVAARPPRRSTPGLSPSGSPGWRACIPRSGSPCRVCESSGKTAGICSSALSGITRWSRCAPPRVGLRVSEALRCLSRGRPAAPPSPKEAGGYRVRSPRRVEAGRNLQSFPFPSTA